MMPALDSKTLSSMKVAELKEELKSRGLDTKGTKPVLLKRLKEAIDEEVGSDNQAGDDSIDYAAVDTTSECIEEDSFLAEPEMQPVAEPESILEPVVYEEDSEEIEDKPTVEVNEKELRVAEAMQEEPAAMSSIVDPVVVATKTMITEEKDEVIDDEPKQCDLFDVPKEASMDTTVSPETNGGKVSQVDLSADIPGEFAVVDEVGDIGTGNDICDREDRHRRRRSRSCSRSPRDRRRTRSRSRERRRRSRSPPPYRQQSAPPKEMESDDWLADTNVILDKYNSDLNLKLEEKYKCHPLSNDGFAFMWAGVRATYGVTKGRIAFEIKIIENQSVSHLPEEESNPHVVRVGFSTDACDLQLGEVVNSYGYGGTAKASENCKFKDYGEPFGKDDVVTSYVDFEEAVISISYAKNGIDLGECFSVAHEKLAGASLFPHILTKNCEFECNFGQNEDAWFPLKEGFTFINTLPLEERTRGSLPPEKKEDCEMLMMCGLPGAGKSVWAVKHAQENAHKKFYVLGTNSIIDKMKVMGLPRKRNYAGRWDVLIDMSTKCLNKFFGIACRKKRNYILDQTNVYPSAQRRKMRPFEGFQRKAIVIVPTDEEFKARVEKREKEEGKDVPDKAVLEMKANFQLPEQGPLFDEVKYIELNKDESTKLVEEYNKEGRAACPAREKGSRFSNSHSSSINVSGGRGRYGGGGSSGYNDRRYESRDRYDNRRDDRRGGDRRYGGDRRDYGSGYRSGYDRNRGSRDDNRSRGYSDRSYGSSSGGSSYGSGGYGNYSSGGYGSSAGGYGSQAGWGQGGWGQGYGQWAGYNQSQGYGQGYGQYQQYWQGYQHPPATQQQYGQWYGYGAQQQQTKK